MSRFYKGVYASVLGITHEQHNTPCQDYCFCAERNGITAICICDGAGSAAYSAKGAEITAHWIVNCLLKNYSIIRCSTDNDRQHFCSQIVSSINRELQNEWKKKLDGVNRLLFKAAKSSRIDPYQTIRERFKQEFEKSFNSCVSEWSENTILNTRFNELSNDETLKKICNDEFYKIVLPKFQELREEYVKKIDALQWLTIQGECSILNNALTSSENAGVKEFACTVVAIAVDQGGNWVSMHLGDGAIVGRDLQGNLFLLSEPENAEYANQTWFITSPNASEKLRINISANQNQIESAVLFSDGPEGSLLSRQTPVDGNNFVINTLFENGFTFEKAQAYIQQFIKEIVQKNSCDDCSIAILKGFEQDAFDTQTGLITNLPYNGPLLSFPLRKPQPLDSGGDEPQQPTDGDEPQQPGQTPEDNSNQNSIEQTDDVSNSLIEKLITDVSLEENSGSNTQTPLLKAKEKQTLQTFNLILNIVIVLLLIAILIVIALMLSLGRNSAPVPKPKQYPDGTRDNFETPAPNRALEYNETPDPNRALEYNETPAPNRALEINETPVPNDAFENNETPDPNGALDNSIISNPNRTQDNSRAPNYSRTQDNNETLYNNDVNNGS